MAEDSPVIPSGSEMDSYDLRSDASIVPNWINQSSLSSSSETKLPRICSLNKSNIELNLSMSESKLLVKMEFSKYLQNRNPSWNFIFHKDYKMLEAAHELINDIKVQFYEWVRMIFKVHFSVPEIFNSELILNLETVISHFNISCLKENIYLECCNNHFPQKPNQCFTASFHDSRYKTATIDLVRNMISNYFHNEFIQVHDTNLMKYLEKYSTQEIEKVGDDKKGLLKVRILTGNNVKSGIILQNMGSKEVIESAKKSLELIIGNVKCRNDTFANSKVDEIFNTHILGIQVKNDVLIFIDVKDQSHLLRDCGRNAVLGSMVNGILITLVEGDIAEQNVDVIVKSTSAQQDVDKEGISKSIYTKTGHELMEICHEHAGLQENIFETPVLEMPYQFIFHCVYKLKPPHVGENHLKALEDSILYCLRRVNEKQLRSIAIPPIGCGRMKLPIDRAVESFLKACNMFAEENKESSLEEIRFAVVDKSDDKNLLNAFKNGITKWINNPKSVWNTKAWGT